MPVIDFSDAKAPEVLEAGDYPATLVDAAYIEKTPTSKAAYVKLTFTVQDGEHDGQKLFRNSSLSKEALYIFKRDMIALGTDPEEFEGSVDPEAIAKENIGHDCLLSVTQRPDQRDPDSMQNNIRMVKSADSFA